MKKVYINPKTTVTTIELRNSLLTLSLQDTGTKANSSTTVLTREDNSWDIWGQGDYEED